VRTLGKIPRLSRFFLSCFLAVGVLVGFGMPATGSADTPPTAPAVPQQTYEAVDAFLQEQLDAMGLPGAAVVVVKDGVQVHSAAFGRADDSGRPMTAQTPVLLASTTKPSPPWR
jgi:CubicO group peptidase (beta-lactamase class C family)